MDSAVSAHLLLRQGYQVVGITMSIGSGREQERPEEDTSYGGRVMNVKGARQVAHRLGIPLHVVDVKKSFSHEVVDYFCREYAGGRTPNPCIKCNEKIKFGTLWQNARRMGAHTLATGHYARIEYDEETHRYVIRKGVDEAKDQSYVLFSLSQDQLSHMRFPLGDLSKAQVMDMARTRGFMVSETEESQEICFVRGRDYRSFLQQRLGKPFGTGLIVDQGGRVLGSHGGISAFTIGQRRGLGVSAGDPLYVIGIDQASNRVIVGPERETLKDHCVASRVNWIAVESLTASQRMEAKIRYAHPGAEATVDPLAPDRVRVRFKRPQKAVTPGQAVVFYQGDMLVGGGWIEKEDDG
jgi:tRNA-specific 2-thiouridylase